MKKLLYKAAALLVTVLACLAVFWGTKFYYSRQVKTVEVIREIPVEKIIEKEVEISGEAIRVNMANIGKLCTAEYSYTHVERVDSQREIQGFKVPFTTATPLSRSSALRSIRTAFSSTMRKIIFLILSV